MTGPRSAGFESGTIAVRAQRHLPQGICDSHPQRIRPQHPKRLDWTTATGEPGPQLAQAGGAKTQGCTGPNGDRAQGREGVGENGTARHGQVRRYTRGSDAGAWMAQRPQNGICRTGTPVASEHGSPAIVGSGHCLQSRISHDSFLVGYDWWIELWVLRWSGLDAL